MTAATPPPADDPVGAAPSAPRRTALPTAAIPPAPSEALSPAGSGGPAGRIRDLVATRRPRSRRATTAPEHPGAAPAGAGEAATGVIPVDQIAAALGYAGDRGHAPAPGRAPRRALRLPGVRILAPAAVVLVALLIVLAVAGVFDSGHSGGSPAAGSATPAGFGAPTITAPPSAADLHRARVRAARRRRAARLRAATAARAAATRTGATTTPPSVAASPSASPTARALATPAASVPPNNGAAPATTGGYKPD
jgi:hypothetical protein